MKERYLEVTYRNGRPFAAYLYLPRAAGAKSVGTETAGHGVLVDYAASGAPIGVEITAPTQVTAEQLNSVLSNLGIAKLTPEELAPLEAA